MSEFVGTCRYITTPAAVLVRTHCAGQNVNHVQADNHLLFAACGEAEDLESDEEELSLPELVPESLLELELELGSGLRFLQQMLDTVADMQTKSVFDTSCHSSGCCLMQCPTFG